MKALILETMEDVILEEGIVEVEEMVNRLEEDLSSTAYALILVCP